MTTALDYPTTLDDLPSTFYANGGHVVTLDGSYLPPDAPRTFYDVVDRVLQLLDPVDLTMREAYTTDGEDAPSPEEVDALGKARRLLVRVVAQLDRAAGGDGGGVPDEQVPELP